MLNPNLLYTDLTVTNIEYVWNGIYMPRSNHMVNRGYHGLVLIRDDPHTYIFDDGSILEAEAGNILYLPAGASYRVSDIKSCDCIAINFRVLEDLEIAPFRYSVGNNMAVYSELFQTASRCWDGKTIGYRNKIKSLLYEILYIMQRDYHPDYVPKGLAVKFNTVLEYIGEHYTDAGISIKELADKAEISEVYFRKQFHKMYNMAPLQYIKQLRFNKAIELLESDMYPVNEVAHMVGYASEYYFCREFKKATGLTPMKFKKEKVDHKLYDTGFPYSCVDSGDD